MNRQRPQTLRSGRRGMPPALPWILLTLSVVLNLWLLWSWPGSGDDARNQEEPGATEQTEATPIPVAEATPTPTPAPTPADSGIRAFSGSVQGAIGTIFSEHLGDLGPQVTALAERLLVWNLDMRRDPRKGDQLDVVVSTEEVEPVVLALRYRSQKQQRTLEAYRFQPAHRTWPSWFDGEGREVPERFVDGPMADYEQITALLGDGRGHDGIDFKAPVGTAVVTPFAGTVRRVNWSTRYNGNCVELSRGDGKKVRFLHLDSVAVKQGQKLAAGARVGESGNTGRSYAPHLHYEIIDGKGRVLDPRSLHETAHEPLEGAALKAFEVERDRLRGLWSSAPSPEPTATVTP